ncbi:TAXI family TRAP transporter solute-binding subunit [Reyranella sp.]|uniref:TAXI family TRAP transporter solute-binding subunit n=1 Tax=Reyranella sp. TaxID=1929291 RepID=UPI0025F4617D|nr:TAXI family TRAP transporter solute-binding subunit [Reyranella sp.]
MRWLPGRRGMLRTGAATAGLLFTGTPVGAQPLKVRLGTATPGGGFPVYGAAFVEGVRRFDPTLEIEAINTRGSTENVPMLETGALDIALVQGEVVHEALQGIGRAPADLRVLTAMYPTAGMFVVRADSPYRTIADLKGKPVAWGAGGSGLVILGRYAMDGLGLDAARDFQPIYLERAGDGPAIVLDGRAAALWGGGSGWPGFVTMANSKEGARFIAPDATEIQRILAKHTFLKPVTQAAGTFKGQTAAIPSVGSWSFVLARPGLDEMAAYRLVKALHAVQQAGKPPPQLVDTTAANTVSVVPGHERLHPGVIRFYREIGLLT